MIYEPIQITEDEVYLLPIPTLPTEDPMNNADKRLLALHERLKAIQKDYENILTDIMSATKISDGLYEYYRPTFDVNGLNNYYKRLKLLNNLIK